MSQHEYTRINEDDVQVEVQSKYGDMVNPGSHMHAHLNGLFCDPCSSKLCGQCQNIMFKLEEKERECERLYRLNAFYLGLSRLPALFVTLGLELIGGWAIDELNSSIQEFILLASFLPIISALSGNLGLQASSNTTRGLATGNIPIKNAVKNTWKEVKSGIIAAFTIALTLAIIGGIWTNYDTKDKEEILHRNSYHLYPIIFALVIFTGTVLSMMVSTLNGALMPIIAHKCNLDPAKIAGPLETAFQDIVGQTFLLGFAKLILIPMFKDEQFFATTVIPNATLGYGR